MTQVHDELLAECVKLGQALDRLSEICHSDNRKWWLAPDGTPLLDNRLVVPTKIALMHSELSEMLEADRKSLMDDKIPFLGVEAEGVDLLIRLFDLAGAKGWKLGEAFVAKRLYNARRIDHTLEHRASAPGGKAY